MKHLFFKKLIFALLFVDAYFIFSHSNLEENNQKNDIQEQKRSIRLNNYPLNIFTPQTLQLQGYQFIKGETGATGATGPATPCLYNYAMLRRTLTGLSGTGIASGDTGTFDEGLFYSITGNPTGSPSVAIPLESITVSSSGDYLIEFSYVGSQVQMNYAKGDFYAKFNLLVNGSVVTTFTLSTFGIRQTWQHIIPLNEGDVVSIQAASDIPFLEQPKGIDIGTIDSFIMILQWIGPCVSPE